MPMTFGEAMLSILKERGLSATAVAEELGFKSRTAFFRILHDESRITAIKNCFEDAKKSALLALNQKEIAQLQEAMRVSELGKQEYGITRVLHKMIYPSAADKNTTEDTLIEGADDIPHFEALLDQMSSMKNIKIVIMGRCPRNIMDRLHRLTKEAPVRKIVHFFALDEEDAEDIKVFAEMSNILFSNVYSVYYINETGVGLKNWWLRSGVILFTFEENSGEKRMLQLTWLGRQRYLYFEDEYTRLNHFWDSLIINVKDDLIPLKLETAHLKKPDMQQYIEFTHHYQKLEQSREIYTIKPDLPIICVPVEILAAPVIDALSQFLPEGETDASESIERLYAIHKTRVENLYSKRKNTHIVLHVDAMMRFAKTGCRSDHVLSSRPYTPQERVQLLTFLRDQAQSNPYFHIWMSRNPNIVSDRELTIYDGYGVALIKGDTSWRLDRDHQEVMLESRMLAKHFKSYFMSSVLGEAVMSKEESLDVLETLIKAAQEA